MHKLKYTQYVRVTLFVLYFTQTIIIYLDLSNGRRDLENVLIWPKNLVSQMTHRYAKGVFHFGKCEWKFGHQNVDFNSYYYTKMTSFSGIQMLHEISDPKKTLRVLLINDQIRYCREYPWVYLHRASVAAAAAKTGQWWCLGMGLGQIFKHHHWPALAAAADADCRWRSVCL